MACSVAGEREQRKWLYLQVGRKCPKKSDLWVDFKGWMRTNQVDKVKEQNTYNAFTCLVTQQVQGSVKIYNEKRMHSVVWGRAIKYNVKRKCSDSHHTQTHTSCVWETTTILGSDWSHSSQSWGWKRGCSQNEQGKKGSAERAVEATFIQENIASRNEK